MSDTENSVRAQNESTSDVDYYRVKAQSILRQMSSMKCYLNADAVNQFDEADLLARMEWINSLNQAFDSAQTSLERLDFSEISSDHRIEFAEVFMDVKAKLNRGLAAHRSLGCQIWKLLVFMDPTRSSRIFLRLSLRLSEMMMS
ncbi:uncharacterized protein LOC119559302 [Drosophila subpulchrella]|uniref:uncharacterized protein LOC119559302 n=1 Tax=Drosophila subpulchrella TaxID=1486046 RepID=UPI0018A1462B|nr:uncharacterized protein LOC119559302 [Drosophila subpulchrella]